MSQDFTTSESISDLIIKEANTPPMSQARINLIARLQEARMWARIAEEHAEEYERRARKGDDL